MTDEKLIDPNLARVLDILEQVKILNEMVDLHEKESGDQLMAGQYRDLKTRFLEELKEILKDFEIEVLIREEAA